MYRGSAGFNLPDFLGFPQIIHNSFGASNKSYNPALRKKGIVFGILSQIIPKSDILSRIEAVHRSQYIYSFILYIPIYATSASISLESS